jgi:hypothetical protein
MRATRPAVVFFTFCLLMLCAGTVQAAVPSITSLSITTGAVIEGLK